jgi:hypothetical protein
MRRSARQRDVTIFRDQVGRPDPTTDADKLAIVTPSMIGGAQRVAFARASLAELQQLLGARHMHVVVDDVPGCRGRLFGVVPNRLTRKIPNLAYIRAAKQIYSQGRNVEVLRGSGKSSTAALKMALARAGSAGRSYVFIHLDDNAYAPALAALISTSIVALDNLPDLNLVRLSAYPILTAECNAEQGNMTLCRRDGDTVRFDGVKLHPVRVDGFTVWKSPWTAATADGRFWPIMLWNAVYRIDFLEQLLSNPAIADSQSLGAVEDWYKTHWATVWPRLAGSFGFINMQFAGLERERNLNWRELLALPNRAVL